MFVIFGVDSLSGQSLKIAHSRYLIAETGFILPVDIRILNTPIEHEHISFGAHTGSVYSKMVGLGKPRTRYIFTGMLNRENVSKIWIFGSGLHELENIYLLCNFGERIAYIPANILDVSSYAVGPIIRGDVRYISAFLPFDIHHYPRSFGIDISFQVPRHDISLCFHLFNLPVHQLGLFIYGLEGSTGIKYASSANYHQGTGKNYIEPVPPYGVYRHGGRLGDDYGLFFIVIGYLASGVMAFFAAMLIFDGRRGAGYFCLFMCVVTNICSSACICIGCLPWDWWRCLHDGQEHSYYKFHKEQSVPQKYLTRNNKWGTVIYMANALNTDKQITVISALAEGSSIRSIERMTGVHRDTIMRLGVKVGKGCAAIMDDKMRNLPCRRLEMDEIWGFVGKKDRNVRIDETSQVGSVWTFCAIDAETKLVPAFKVGERSAATAKAFVQDVADRMSYRVQISTDGLTAYVPAMEAAFGGNVDYAQIIKTYGHEEVSNNRRYSAPDFVSSEKKVIVGNPDERLISTSYIERLNATTRLHMRRLTRLTLAFSKKRENFEAAVAMHFAYYNFVKRHNTLRCTPAMAAGVENSFWSVGNLVEAAA